MVATSYRFEKNSPSEKIFNVVFPSADHVIIIVVNFYSASACIFC